MSREIVWTHDDRETCDSRLVFHKEFYISSMYLFQKGGLLQLCPSIFFIIMARMSHTARTMVTY